MFKNKFIIFLIGFYIFWLGLMPLLATNLVKVLTKNFSHNSKYEIVIENPKVTCSILPVVSFSANKIDIRSKLKNQNLINIIILL